MFDLVAVSAITLSLAASVSSLTLPRSTPPPGWNTALLEPYDTYHTRYLALGCDTQHGTTFFDQCCHPLLATQSLASRPAQCNPATSSKPASPVAAPTHPATSSKPAPPVAAPSSAADDSDSATAVVPATTKAAPPVTSHPAVVKRAATPPRAPAQPAAKPSTPSGSNTGGFATFFYQNGVAGQCGTVHEDSDMIAAIDQDRYGNPGTKSSLCGQQVIITNTRNQKSVTVTIADGCPTCANVNSIDLTSGAFQEIATLDEGWCPVSPLVVQMEHELTGHLLVTWSFV
ncbi:hypothetical protein GALMADRAFT_75279 [Galerina marginata CBS 339.88]|uniref:RlpA-like protein double-psi beta-barrel domain-containing protein n=1 Tax=Galerina marginata (strain CBS 339.88) TaxID=685588 RepID=A0A067STX7_GALM3|nr:hypothetical protein GALMADRAFT_75279 [Galerina marginata CBS 339.88]